MTVEENISHIREAAMEEARARGNEIIDQHQKALEGVFKTHKQEAVMQADTRIKTETASARQQLNTVTSKGQLKLRRQLSRVQNELKNKLFEEVREMAEEYHFVRIITREGAAIRPLLQATSWKPSEVEKDLAQTRKNKQFWAKVQDETEKMARFYPAYLKVGVEEVTLSDTMLRILKLQADGMSKEKIAAELNMTTANVKYHTQQIYKRLGVSNKAGAVMEAGKRGLI